ncbi:pantoate--beta-alanine ligase [Roseospirillum parvum]|uniref:Pantothenate synthetase n=1 Tax=Roseospirillum parvum TaxID=83401 RepID=A0A1G7X1A0_9PROT|nr:pantoate--beta-alanine ligase [Roseospirillum parvum]SDG77931.1 pantoate--beta-alanine ligase [Roseospirillum parvum]
MKSTALPPVARSPGELRAEVAALRAAGASVALVPTMGSLHAGHLALVRRAAEMADKVVVSIFVNPTQFAPHEDFDSYPRHFENDRASLAAEGLTHLVYYPGVGDMYPEGFATQVSVSGVSEGLCATTRPHFFDGVALVVAKLLNQCRPDVALFGEKDFQQLQVIRRLVADLDIGVRIEGVPIVREPDGLALSSRNAYLTEEQRARAAHLPRVLARVAGRVAMGEDVGIACREGIDELFEAGFDKVDYLEVRREADLSPVLGRRAPDQTHRPARVLAAAHLGRTRLIDNMPVQ